MKRVLLICVLATISMGAVWSGEAHADDAKIAFGVRPLGFSLDPDQFVVGLQMVLGRVQMARFAPSVDFGFGEDQTLTTVNLDAKLDLFSPPKASARFYAGLGPTISIISPDQGDSDTEIGFSVLGGLKLPFGSRHYYNLESRFGFGDIPEFKLLVGAMFGFGRLE